MRTGKQRIRTKRELSSRQGGARIDKADIGCIVPYRIATCPGVCKLHQKVFFKYKTRARKHKYLLIYIDWQYIYK